MNRIKKFFKKNIKPILEPMAKVLIFGIVGVIMYFAVFIYYMKYIGNFPKNAETLNLGYNFDIGILSATIGGFALIGGFFDKTPASVKKELINTSRCFLITAVFSTIFTFILPVFLGGKPEQGSGYWFLFAALTASMFLSVLGFTFGTTLLIPCLWKIGRTK